MLRSIIWGCDMPSLGANGRDSGPGRAVEGKGRHIVSYHKGALVASKRPGRWSRSCAKASTWEPFRAQVLSQAGWHRASGVHKVPFDEGQLPSGFGPQGRTGNWWGAASRQPVPPVPPWSVSS